MISKFLQGGGFDALFTTYIPIKRGSSRGSGSSSEDSHRSSRKESKSKDDDSDKGKLTEKDLFTMLKDLDGLPNEMLALVKDLSKSILVSLIENNGDIGDIASKYLNSLYKLKTAKYNRDLFKTTMENAAQKDSLNDIAITPEGRVLALDADNKISSFSTEEWAKVRNNGEYRPLTNSNLLWMRSHLPDYANRNDLFLIVENGIGLEQVHKMIKDRFHQLGTLESSLEAILPKAVALGMEIIGNYLLYGPEGYYKIALETSSTDLKLIEAALTYIYSTLPANARTRLAVETKDGKDESAIAIVLAYIFQTVSSKSKTTVDYLGTEDKLLGKTKEDKEGKIGDIELGTAAKWVSGYGNKETFVINLGGTHNYAVQSNSMPLVDMNGNYLGANSNLLQLTLGQFNSVLDTNSVSMGMKLIDPSAFSTVLLTDGKINSVDFPCIELNGVIMPDLSPQTRDAKSRADAEIRRRGIRLNDPKSIQTNYQTINQIYQHFGLPPAYNANGELMPGRWRRFGVINGRASNKSLGMRLSDTNILLLEEKDDNIVKNYLTTVKEENWDTNNWFWNGVDHLYKGTIWIPVQISYHSAQAYKGMKASDALALELRELANDTRKSLQLGRQPQ